ncbi:IclR family transcriptional regulator C-terminal domain-containing protein [Variovorax guangxiensis]|uniref:IclR family transcriptional regulator n=1 Tax=Variovorax guangxiensis TaxID=1775474 RepID=UPI002858500B|nr:IclR family transcriptional regulator C-terminal domain-containing protein [Variovorax guangxiensis]MDR6858783.1 DNA-binding IclR family transcriptional regulator [Variovorax guangxiensis]
MAELVAPARAKRVSKAAQASYEADTAEDAPSNSLVKLLDVLDLFTPAAPVWSSEELIRSQGLSRSTGYRYIKALSDAGLLAAVANGHYILGPRIIQLDHQIRQCDPLYISADGMLEPLVEATGCSAQVCALYSSTVLCVREELTSDSPANILSRGQQRPLFLGAASKCILAYLRPHQLRSIYGKYAKTIATAGLGADWAAFRATLARIRSNGYTTTVGEINPGVFGLSAPVFNRSGHILGSLGITASAARIKRSDIEGFAKQVVDAAATLTERVSNMNIGTDRPPRAVG